MGLPTPILRLKMLAGFVLSILDIGSDILVTKNLYDSGEHNFFLISLAILCMPTLVQIASVIVSQRCYNVFHTLQGILQAIFQYDLLVGSYRGIVGTDRLCGRPCSRPNEVLDQLKRVERAHFAEVIFESIPQVALTSYIIMRQFTMGICELADGSSLDPSAPDVRAHGEYLCRAAPTAEQTGLFLSMVLSLASVVFTMGMQRGSSLGDQGAIRGNAYTMINKPYIDSVAFRITAMVWTAAEVGARALAIMLFSVAFQGYLFVALLFEWAVRTLLLCFKDANKCCAAKYCCVTRYGPAICWLCQQPLALIMHGQIGGNMLVALRATMASPTAMREHADWLMGGLSFIFLGIYTMAPILVTSRWWPPSLHPTDGGGLSPGPLARGLCNPTQDVRTALSTRALLDCEQSGKLPGSMLVAIACLAALQLLVWLAYQFQVGAAADRAVHMQELAEKHRDQQRAAAAAAAAQGTTGQAKDQVQLEMSPVSGISSATSGPGPTTAFTAKVLPAKPGASRAGAS